MANSFLTGAGIPTGAVGEISDYYRDIGTNLIYYHSPTGWEAVPSLIPTPDGVGTNWLFGTGAPDNGIGATNDYYRDEDNGSIYRKHALNGWEAKGSLDFIGVYGVQWGEGLGAPANIESLNNLPAGSFYLDINTSDIYYKDNTLTWSLKGQLGGGSYVESRFVKGWAYTQAFAATSVTRNVNNVITTASIVWPDGATGTLTTDIINTTFNTIDAWHATHILNGVTKTVTQTAVTRNSSGAVIAQPEITIS